METLFIGKNMLFLPEVESTNTYAMHMLRNVNVMEGTVIHTDDQTKGKGQRGSFWNSAVASNITCSIILKPVFLNTEKSFFLSKISALAVHDLLTDILGNSHYDIKIKWPNDIFVNSKKIAGILIENIYQASGLQFSVTGIGLNVNQTEFYELVHSATSLNLLTGSNYDRQKILIQLCSFFEKWYLILKAGKFQFINDAYLHHLFGLNESLQFMDNNQQMFEGVIIDVSNDGKLCLKKNDGNIIRFDIKELKFLQD